MIVLLIARLQRKIQTRVILLVAGKATNSRNGFCPALRLSDLFHALAPAQRLISRHNGLFRYRKHRTSWLTHSPPTRRWKMSIEKNWGNRKRWRASSTICEINSATNRESTRNWNNRYEYTMSCLLTVFWQALHILVNRTCVSAIAGRMNRFQNISLYIQSRNIFMKANLSLMHSFITNIMNQPLRQR